MAYLPVVHGDDKCMTLSSKVATECVVKLTLRAFENESTSVEEYNYWSGLDRLSRVFAVAPLHFLVYMVQFTDLLHDSILLQCMHRLFP